MNIQKSMTLATLASFSFPCDRGQPPAVGFESQRSDGSTTNIGLSTVGTHISDGAKANIFANLRNACLGHQNKEPLAASLYCAPAAGIVMLCEDVYRCGEPGFEDGVRVGSSHYNNVSAHLTVAPRDQRDPLVLCYVEKLATSQRKGMDDFPRTTPPECSVQEI